jgi:hypothetical protein
VAACPHARDGAPAVFRRRGAARKIPLDVLEVVAASVSSGRAPMRRIEVGPTASSARCRRWSGAAPAVLARLQGGARAVASSFGAERGRLLREARNRKTTTRLAWPGGSARWLPAALLRRRARRAGGGAFIGARARETRVLTPQAAAPSRSPGLARHGHGAGPGWAWAGLAAGLGQTGLEEVKRWASEGVKGGRADLGSWAVDKSRWAAVWASWAAACKVAADRRKR